MLNAAEPIIRMYWGISTVVTQWKSAIVPDVLVPPPVPLVRPH